MNAEQLQFKDGPLWLPSLNRNLTWRRMRHSDLDQILELETQLFASPWSRQMFEEELRETKHVLPLVLEEAGSIAGYLITYFVADELHIANVGTAPGLQRRGIGERMMQSLLDRAREDGFMLAHLEVRRSNRAAITLYEKLGFRIVGVRKNYYQQEKEDALLMTLLLHQEHRA
jgi:[ribosomal protein S18]-alanine N-acetyltransferase